MMADNSNQHLSKAHDLAIDEICLRFERELRADREPSIDDFLASTRSPILEPLLAQLLLLELEYAANRGIESIPADYEYRFPAHTDVVRRVFLQQRDAVSETRPEAIEQAPQADADSDSSPSDASVHGRFLPGARVAERYRIVSLIGKGGMGEVYRADDLRLGQTVALKFLPRDVADDPKRLKYFYNEVRIARQISHPNVCRVHDIVEVDGERFFGMEYVDGEDLKILLGRIGRLPNDKGVEIARQLCAGLAAAHNKRVLHRDLKPANVMIDGRGQVRITDFGLATLASEPTEMRSTVGTPAYMAPEQLMRGEVSVQTDI